MTVSAAANDRLAAGCALLTVVLWSTVATAFKLALEHLDIFQLLLVSSATATMCLYAMLLVRGQYDLPWRQSRTVYLQAFLLGCLNPLAYYLVLFAAYARLPAQVAQALNYTWTIALMLLSVPLLKQQLRPADVAGAVICYSGVVLVCMGGAAFLPGMISAAGVALALGSTLIWALYWIAKTRDRADPVLSLFLSFLLSLPLVLLACLAFSSLRPLPVQGLAPAIYVGFAEMGITFVLWLSALRHASSAAKVSTLIFITPFLSLIFIHQVLQEPVPATTVAGLALVVGGLLAQARMGRTRQAATREVHP